MSTDYQPRMMRRAARIRVEVEQGAVDLQAECVNLSPSGMAFELEEPLFEGDRFRIIIYLPVGKDLELIRVAGEAVRSEPAEDPDKTRVAAAFHTFAPGDERRLKKWLLENKSYPPPPTEAPRK